MTCVECGNDDAVRGYPLCPGCLEAGQLEFADVTGLEPATQLPEVPGSSSPMEDT